MNLRWFRRFCYQYLMSDLRGAGLFIVVALIFVMAGSAAPAKAAGGVSSLTQEQAALYLGCVGAISTQSLSGGQPAASTTLLSQYKSLPQLTSLNIIQFAVLEDHALRSYGCCLCENSHKRAWLNDALKQFSGLGSASAFTPSTCLSTAAGFNFSNSPTCTCSNFSPPVSCP